MTLTINTEHGRETGADRRSSPSTARANAEAALIVQRLLTTPATQRQLAEEYGCSKYTIYTILKAGSTVTERRAAHVGKIGTKFLPGQEPWNKGVKGLHLSPATEFKQGVLRGQAARNWKATGFIAVRSDRNGQQSRWIKVRDDGPPRYRWAPYARSLWEREHGPVPHGHFIAHDDNDSMNDSLENLICITREDLTLRLRQRPDAMKKWRRSIAKANAKRFAVQRQLKEAKPTMPTKENPGQARMILDLPSLRTRGGQMAAKFVASLDDRAA